MANGMQPIKVPPDSELARSLREAEAQGHSLTVDIGDTLLDVFVEGSVSHEHDPASGALERVERSRKFRVKPGTGAQAKDMIDHLIATAQPDSDLLQELAVSDQRDPTSVVIAR